MSSSEKDKKDEEKVKQPSSGAVLLDSVESDVEYVAWEPQPAKLPPTYTTVSYFAGHCVPGVDGNCGGLIPDLGLGNLFGNWGNDKPKKSSKKSKVKSEKSTKLKEEPTPSPKPVPEPVETKDVATGPSRVVVDKKIAQKPGGKQDAAAGPSHPNVSSTQEKEQSESEVSFIVKPKVETKVAETKTFHDVKMVADEPNVQVVVFTRESTDAVQYVCPSDTNTKQQVTSKVITSAVVQQKSRYDIMEVQNTNVNLQQVRAESKASFMEMQSEIKSGLRGLYTYVDKRSQMMPETKSQYDFIDHFAAKEGCKYIAVLEKLHNEYRETLDRLIKGTVSVGKKDKINEAGQMIAKIHEIVAVDEERQFLDFNFPVLMETILSKFSVDFNSKLAALQKVHNYGIEMIEHWLKRLETKTKPIFTKDVFSVASEMMADTLIICFTVFNKIAEFLHKLSQEPSGSDKVEKFSLDFLTKLLRRLLDCICDEVGAFAEACGQIVIRIPDLNQDEVVRTMTRIYTQVNYAQINASRAIESMEPIINVYCIRHFVTSPN